MKNRLFYFSGPSSKPSRRPAIRPAQGPEEGKRARGQRVKPAVSAESMPPRTGVILVPVDFSERSRNLVRQACLLAKRLRAELVLLHVYERYEYASACISLDHFRRTNERIELLALQNLKKFQAGFPDEAKALAARTIVASGYLEETVAKTARDVDAELIAVTSHHRQGFKRFFMGSRAELISRNASCPVLIMPVQP